VSRDVLCPYCGTPQDINHDDGYGYEEDQLHQQECRECEKTFAYTTTIATYYKTYQADCLNDGEHQWERTKTYPPEFARLRCKTCGDEMPITSEATK
jgi:hypothetical protein